MTNLTFGQLELPGSLPGTNSSMPPLCSMRNLQQRTLARLDETDELFIGYGCLDTILPYLEQDVYTRELLPLTLKTAELENEFLKAVFLPSLGGRLWRLYDKKAQKDLLYTNDVLQPCNLALRNAWFSGGVEWNMGLIGHSPFTCSPLFVANVDAETPVLRMYEYERIRKATYQMDFFLPDDSCFLHCRMRIVNPNNSIIPMYWWSNIAVPETEKARVIVPAEQAYTTIEDYVTKISVPFHDGTDITYPRNTKVACDYFFKLQGDNRYLCQVDADGNGLLQASTERLKGRKCFVWGQGRGGKRWQKFLTKDEGCYNEVQCGLGKTQYECLPMPPHTAWEWLEVYGAIHLNPAQVHDDYTQAQKNVERYITAHGITRETLEQRLVDTRPMALQPATLVASGSGYGALENLRLKKESLPPLSEHLSFPFIEEEQRLWEKLLNEDYKAPSPKTPPTSYMIGKEWYKYLQKAALSDASNWWVELQLGVMAFADRDFVSADTHFEHSIRMEETAVALTCLANTSYKRNQSTRAATYAERAICMAPDDISVVRNMMRILTDCGESARIPWLYQEVLSPIFSDKRCRYYLCNAYCEAGQTELAEDLLYKDEGLEIPDIREGEVSITELWYRIEKQKAEKAHLFFDDQHISPPEMFDFRMFVPEINY